MTDIVCNFFHPSAVLTVKEALEQATDWLIKKNIFEAKLNVEYLLANILKVSRLALYFKWNAILSDQQQQQFCDEIHERSQGIPLQHILGNIEFFGSTFKCDRRALIPRPETELLVARALEHNFSSVLDVGTGSGVIGLTLAMKIANISVIGTDISDDALALAKENQEYKNIKNIVFQKSDMMPINHEKFDIIIANLPYIPTHIISSLSLEVRNDPVLALDGGENGTEIIERLIQRARPYFNNRGILLLEIGDNQTDRIISCLNQNNYHSLTILDDYSLNSRFIEAYYG